MSIKYKIEQVIEDLQKLSKKFAKETGQKTEDIPRDYFRANTKYTDFEKLSSYKKLKELAFTRDVLTRQDIEQHGKSSNKSEKRYFVTAVVAGQSINKKFWNNVQSFCKKNNAELILLPMRGVKKIDEIYDEDIKNFEDYLYTEYVFCSNLKAMDMMLSPQHINPLSRLKRLGQKKYSLVIASPKQFMEVVPVGTNCSPHVLFSTGVITNCQHYAKNPVGVIAGQDHTIGGLVIEVNDKQEFFVRQVQADNKGGFWDLEVYYNDEQIPSDISIYLGDYHIGWHNKVAVAATKELVRLVKPKKVIMGDVFDGTSISHHHIGNNKAQVERPEHLETLEKELNCVGEELCTWVKEFPDTQIYILDSNHHDHLIQYLSFARYVDDPQNHRLALKLAVWMLDKKNPIEEYINEKFKITDKIIWLKSDDSLKVKGIELALHGHKGANGRFGTAQSLEDSYGSCVVGHHHTPQIFRNVRIVGTLSIYELPYTKGYSSSWLNTNALIYGNGQVTLSTIIDGSFRI